MFTGIIREMGTVRRRSGIAGGVRLEIDAPRTARSARHGDSIAVDGCCLTVVKRSGTRIAFDLSPETLSRTIAKDYRPLTAVNLESSLRMGDTLGGHLVTGHVDAVGRVERLTSGGEFAVLTVKIATAPRGLVAEKGSITINGVSLTVAAWRRGCVEIALIPETLERTNLSALRRGGRVNIEFDLIARYVTEALGRRVNSHD